MTSVIEYDLVVIGSGPGGQKAAVAAAKLGKSVAVIERGDVGGVCGKTEEALNFYVSVFKNAPNAATAGENKAEILARYGEGEEA